jgi:peptidoglycan/LPS O-acetylase OafA/YrhL
MNAAISMKYRSDIDGLRAVAVCSVLLFHGFPSWFSGGYVGVDIFFVISGYLITEILVREARSGVFSIKRFYIRRARRIFPALLLVLLATLFASWLIMLPVEWRNFGEQLGASAIFVSNVVLWREAGYFDRSSDLKPLLHLWSLAVEEQYYLVWPLIVYMFSGHKDRFLQIGCVALIAISLALSVLLTPTHSVAAFYLPLTRVWELLIGSGLVFISNRQWFERLENSATGLPVESILGFLGLGLILAALFLFDKTTPFPSWYALVPDVGAALLILASLKSWPNRHLLASKPMVWLGLISYPLYLWHWPLLSLGRLWVGEALPSAHVAGLLVLSLALAWVTMRWIESPIRAKSRDSLAGRDAALLWAALLGIGAVGLAARTHFIEPRSSMSSLVGKITSAQIDWTYANDRDFKGSLPGRVLFVGDSHMQQYEPRVAEIVTTASSHTMSASIMTLAGCAPVPGFDRRAVKCAEFTDRAYKAMMASDVKAVVIAASWVGFAQRSDYFKLGDPLRRLVNPYDEQEWLSLQLGGRLRDVVGTGKKVYVVLSSPRGRDMEPQRMVERSLWTWPDYSPGPRTRDQLKSVVREYDEQIERIAREAGAEIIDPFDSLCQGDQCPVMAADGLPVLIDESHLRASYVRQNIHFFDRILSGS